MMKIIYDPIYTFLLIWVSSQDRKKINFVLCNVYVIHCIFKGDKKKVIWHRDWVFAKRKNYIDIFKQLDLDDNLCQINETSVVE